MDAKTYIKNRFNHYYGGKGMLPTTCIENILNDPRLKIELLPPPPRFEVHRAIFGNHWNVVDVKSTSPDVVATFTDQARAIDYAIWQNSLEE